MFKIISLSKKSLFNRKFTTCLTIFSIALSVVLLLGIERIKNGTRKSFESTISQVDLIVGARSGPVNLLLYSVFRIGDATNNVSYDTFKEFDSHEEVEWTIPISLGDSHKGFRVLGTNLNYFKYYQFSGDQRLNLREGREFQKIFEVVIGADVARQLSYKVGDQITLSHGTSRVAFQDHKDKPFYIVGILKKTGTPVDGSLHVSLEAIEALHIDWKEGAPPRPGEGITPNQMLAVKLKPKAITAFFVRLKSKVGIFRMQREVNEYEKEAMTAILPGVSLQQLWKTLGLVEKVLQVVSFFVFAVSLVSMLIALLTTLNERRREMSIFRSVGARPRFIFSILVFESGLLALLGILFGTLALYLGLYITQPILEDQLGLTVGLFAFTMTDIFYFITIFIGAISMGFIPAWSAYRKSLSDGLIVRL